MKKWWSSYFDGFTEVLRLGIFTRRDWLFYALCAIAGAVSFQHFDLFQTAPHGIMVWESMARGEFFNYYDYVQRTGGFGAAYNIVMYCLLAVWGLPIFLYNLFAGSQLPLYLIVAYYKLLLLLFGFLSAVQLVRTANVLKLDIREKGLICVLFLTSPLLFLHLGMLGQYDIFSLYFTLLAFEFFLKRQLWRFTFMIALAACFKQFALFLFLPLILFAEKRLWRLLGFALVAALPSILVMLPFSQEDTDGFSVVRSAFLGLFQSEIAGGVYPASLFFSGFALLCFYAYGCDGKLFEKRACFLPLAVFSLLFAFTPWHPQWLILIVPYALLNFSVNARGDRKVLLFSDIIFFFGSVGVMVIQWTRCYDHQTLRNVWECVSGTRYFSQALEMADIYGAGAPFTVFYSSLMFAALAYWLWRCFPRDGESDRRPIELWGVYLRLASILFFVIPALIAYFYSGRCEKKILEKQKITKGFLYWIDPEEEEIYGSGHEKRKGTFDIFLRSRNPVVRPFVNTADREYWVDLALRKELRLQLDPGMSPAPRAVEFFFDGFSLKKDGAVRCEVKSLANGKSYTLGIPFNFGNGEKFATIPLFADCPPPYEITFSGKGLRMRFYGKLNDGKGPECPDFRWIPRGLEGVR